MTKKPEKWWIPVVCALVLAAGVAYTFYGKRNRPEAGQEIQKVEKEKPDVTKAPEKGAPRTKKSWKKKNGSSHRTKREADADDKAVVSNEATQALDDALNADNKKSILEEARKLRTHPDPEVRSQVAFALDWLGVEGLEELTAMLGDKDPDVAREVLDYWESAVSGISDQVAKANLITNVIQSRGDVLSTESFEGLIDTARFELDEPNDLGALLVILKDTDEKKTEWIDILRENINALTGGDARTKAELQQTGQSTFLEQKAEAAKEAADNAEDATGREVLLPGTVE